MSNSGNEGNKHEIENVGNDETLKGIRSQIVSTINEKDTVLINELIKIIETIFFTIMIDYENLDSYNKGRKVFAANITKFNTLLLNIDNNDTVNKIRNILKEKLKIESLGSEKEGSLKSLSIVYIIKYIFSKLFIAEINNFWKQEIDSRKIFAKSIKSLQSKYLTLESRLNILIHVSKRDSQSKLISKIFLSTEFGNIFSTILKSPQALESLMEIYDDYGEIVDKNLILYALLLEISHIHSVGIKVRSELENILRLSDRIIEDKRIISSPADILKVPLPIFIRHAELEKTYENSYHYRGIKILNFDGKIDHKMKLIYSQLGKNGKRGGVFANLYKKLNCNLKLLSGFDRNQKNPFEYYVGYICYDNGEVGIKLITCLEYLIGISSLYFELCDMIGIMENILENKIPKIEINEKTGETYIVFYIKGGTIEKERYKSIGIPNFPINLVNALPDFSGSLEETNTPKVEINDTFIRGILETYGISHKIIREFKIERGKERDSDKGRTSKKGEIKSENSKSNDNQELITRIFDCLNEGGFLDKIIKIHISENNKFIAFHINNHTIFIPYLSRNGIYYTAGLLDIENLSFESLKEIENNFKVTLSMVNQNYKGQLWKDKFINNLGLSGNESYSRNVKNRLKEIVEDIQKKGIDIRNLTFKQIRKIIEEYNSKGENKINIPVRGTFIGIIGGNNYITNFVGHSEYIGEYILSLIYEDSEKSQKIEKEIMELHMTERFKRRQGEKLREFLKKIKNGTIILTIDMIKQWNKNPILKRELGVPDGMGSNAGLIINFGGNPKQGVSSEDVEQHMTNFILNGKV